MIILIAGNSTWKNFIITKLNRKITETWLMLSGTAPIKTCLILKGIRKNKHRRIKSNLEKGRGNSTYTWMGFLSYS